MPEDETTSPAPTTTLDTISEHSATTESKARFAKALDEAKGGAAALTKEAQERAGAVANQIAAKGSDLVENARTLTGQAKERAAALAEDGKARASDALSGLSKVVADNSTTIDEKLGPQYGDYARSAAQSIQDVAARIDAKDLNELGEDVKSFVRSSPGLAVGIAAVAGFMLARMFKSSED